GIAPQGLRHRAPSGWRGSGDVPGLLDRRRPPPALPGERCPRSLSRLAARAARVPTLAGWRRLVVPCGRAGVSSAHAGDGLAYLALTKPDVSFLVVLTTAAGYYMGSRGPLELARLAQTVFGTTLLAAGTSALNHYLERGSDARMRRTASRPLPSGLLTPSQAF